MKEDDIMVTRQDLNRIIVEKVKQNNHDMRETTVVIQGGRGEGASVIELTQAEFDALENKDQGFYLITHHQL